jgi:hypothetical protein
MACWVFWLDWKCDFDGGFNETHAANVREKQRGKTYKKSADSL